MCQKAIISICICAFTFLSRLQLLTQRARYRDSDPWAAVAAVAASAEVTALTNFF